MAASKDPADFYGCCWQIVFPLHLCSGTCLGTLRGGTINELNPGGTWFQNWQEINFERFDVIHSQYQVLPSLYNFSCQQELKHYLFQRNWVSGTTTSDISVLHLLNVKGTAFQISLVIWYFLWPQLSLKCFSSVQIVLISDWGYLHRYRYSFPEPWRIFSNLQKIKCTVGPKEKDQRNYSMPKLLVSKELYRNVWPGVPLDLRPTSRNTSSILKFLCVGGNKTPTLYFCWCNRLPSHEGRGILTTVYSSDSFSCYSMKIWF